MCVRTGVEKVKGVGGMEKGEGVGGAEKGEGVGVAEKGEGVWAVWASLAKDSALMC